MNSVIMQKMEKKSEKKINKNAIFLQRQNQLKTLNGMQTNYNGVGGWTDRQTNSCREGALKADEGINDWAWIKNIISCCCSSRNSKWNQIQTFYIANLLIAVACNSNNYKSNTIIKARKILKMHVCLYINTYVCVCILHCNSSPKQFVHNCTHVLSFFNHLLKKVNMYNWYVHSLYIIMIKYIHVCLYLYVFTCIRLHRGMFVRVFMVSQSDWKM